MSDHQPSIPPLFTHIDVTSDRSAEQVRPNETSSEEILGLLRQMVHLQQRQSQAIEELTRQLAAQQKQRSQELAQWKEANPILAEDCRLAAETLGKVQTEFLQRLTDEVSENAECLIDGEFMLAEFVDRFGPRLAHLNGVLQVLAQLGNGAEAQPQQK